MSEHDDMDYDALSGGVVNVKHERKVLFTGKEMVDEIKALKEENERLKAKLLARHKELGAMTGLGTPSWEYLVAYFQKQEERYNDVAKRLLDAEAEVARLTKESEGRRRELFRVEEERRQEWQRAEKAEAEAQEAWKSEHGAQALAEEMMAERNATQGHFEEMTKRWKLTEAEVARLNLRIEEASEYVSYLMGHDDSFYHVKGVRLLALLRGEVE